MFGGSFDTAHDVFGLLMLYDPARNAWQLPAPGAGPGQVAGSPPSPRCVHGKKHATIEALVFLVKCSKVLVETHVVYAKASLSSSFLILTVVYSNALL